MAAILAALRDDGGRDVHVVMEHENVQRVLDGEPMSVPPGRVPDHPNLRIDIAAGGGEYWRDADPMIVESARGRITRLTIILPRGFLQALLDDDAPRSEYGVEIPEVPSCPDLSLVIAGTPSAEVLVDHERDAGFIDAGTLVLDFRGSRIREN